MNKGLSDWALLSSLYKRPLCLSEVKSSSENLIINLPFSLLEPDLENRALRVSLSTTMKAFYIITQLIAITAAMPNASPEPVVVASENPSLAGSQNPSAIASRNPALDLAKRESCRFGSYTGTCVNTNNGNACSNGRGFLVTNLCSGGNSNICCITTPGACACIG